MTVDQHRLVAHHPRGRRRPDEVIWREVRYSVDVVDGLEDVPAALDRLFEGTNSGELLARVCAEETAGAR
ncbi:hypothetical protein [Kineococcus terrestris]|uniref:hypothetical protein n=1 Tax=Kineococcus terrestris TaxID=2044856 RepID=UPI0034DB51D4